ncbi:hypothetical protein ASPVEDRAFT_755899 [Aspergillus versicolor CBS 583.65]|uniref:Uncharacterized protein n=1 Tax=Aspergillus versicolor CBS 583.65 TaxID=1036611 RepID=A0A1L9PQG6_ASPVE|nr:uncharacterized protein ASPVEDRAFT_755899 [Aspergillus versicolor CBS 583.65]OJJ03777.1 hypothetical protein ASPVEDRAFT_755899 [Aspergillus versicolor CBS 583.65]
MVLAFGRIQRFGTDFESQCSVTVYREMCIILKSNLYIPEVTQHYTEICKFPVSSLLCGSKRSHARLPGESLPTCPRPRRFVFIFLPSLSINLPTWFPFHPYLNPFPYICPTPSYSIYIPGFLLYLDLYPSLYSELLTRNGITEASLYKPSSISVRFSHPPTGNPSATTATKHGRARHSSE